jgi:8-oxo-dGTP pyrophosphatase MutT (NUDIX family)
VNKQYYTDPQKIFLISGSGTEAKTIFGKRENVNRSELTDQLKQYQTEFSEEAVFIEKFLTLLQHPRAFHRDHLPGHMTGSAWIINHDRTKVLLIHHAKLDRWLQPGGHADGDENILAVARKEAEEETGLQNLTLLHSGLFDIDIHMIPERKDFPRHDHYDIRFAFEAAEDERLEISPESKDLAWISIDDLASVTNSNHSMTRMAKKVKALF